LLTTRHQWIDNLAAKSDVVAKMRLDTIVDDAELNGDSRAFYVANCNEHSHLITRAVDALATTDPLSKPHVRNLLARLVRRVSDTYSAFAELAAYEWLARCNVIIETRVTMTASEVLATNGSTLDGKITHCGIYFDVKAFGSEGLLANRLKERLQQHFTDEQVLVEQSWALSFEFEELIRSSSSIAAELRQKRLVQKGRLTIRLAAKQPVTVSSRRNSPFILILAFHPWFNAGSLHDDFAGAGTTFTRSLARRAFMQFSNDTRPLASICSRVVPATTTLADASRLLSGMFFVNVWPLEAMPAWLYSNPRAAHSLMDLSLFRTNNGTYIDYFIDDDY
jgi:hypothetical protein